MTRALLAVLLLLEPLAAAAATYKAPAVPREPLAAPALAAPPALPALPDLAAPVPLPPPAALPAPGALPEARQRLERPAVEALRASAERLVELSAPQGSAPASPAPVSAELGRLFENAVAAGEPSGPFADAPSAVAGRASGLAPPARPLESIQTLRVGSYNVENLFYQVGSHVPDPDRPGMLKKVSEARPKPDWAMAEQGKLIREEGLDVLVLQEVEDAEALDDFNERFLGGAYRTFLIEGNDSRGIDVAFLVKRDIPFELEQRTHKDETWTDPVLGGTKKLFSRDLTSLIFRAPGKADPLFILFGTHYKSKRDRSPRDPESNILRAAQAKRTAEILARYRREFGEVPLMLAGDFNGSVPKDAAFEPLFREAGLTDAFDASPSPPSERDRVTHTYHPRGGPAHYAQMDALLVAKSLRGTVSSASVYRYKDADGKVKPLPRTYEEREKNPSDHFPVIVSLLFQPILTGRFPDWKPAPRPLAAALPSAGAALRDFIWAERVLPSAYRVLPVSNGGWRNALKALRAFLTLRRTFEHDGDELPRSRMGFKLLHPFGSVLKVRYRSRPGHPFTGLLAGAEVPGLIRLSLGAPQKSGKFIPGTALKLFPDGAPSANAVFLGERTGVDGQQPDRNFFAQAFTNDLPRPRTLANRLAAFVLGLFNRRNALYVPVDAFAGRSPDGSAVADPRAPYRLVLRPVPGRAVASDAAREFREELSELPAGDLFEVHAAAAPGAPLLHIGDLEALSRPVASEYGDKGLFFRHRRGRPARPARK